jgi:hypothetical protein
MSEAGLERLLFAGVKSNHEASFEVHSDFDGAVILHEAYEHSCKKKMCKLCSSSTTTTAYDSCDHSDNTIPR